MILPGDTQQGKETFIVVTSWGLARASEIQCVQARDAAKHTSLHRAAPTAKDDLVQNANGAKAEKPCQVPFTSIVPVHILQ